jgi:hypothetical protein
MSCYVPGWVKTDTARFARVRLKSGAPVEILSPFSEENLSIDLRAFVQLMHYLKNQDHDRRVILVQVENEVGMIPEARDACDAANFAYESTVPEEMLAFLAEQPASSSQPFVQRYRERGCPSQGNWEAVFGSGHETEEWFMAYHFARYIERLAAAGKAVYPIPMYVNAALNRPDKLPGEYPSAGPLPHLAEIWQKFAPHIDLLSPDIYFPEFVEWCEKYRAKNPLFIPEATNGTECTAHALYAIGACQAIGFSPFTVEAISPKDSTLGQAYGALGALSDVIVSSRGRGAMGAVLLTKESPCQELSLSGYRFRFTHDLTWEWSGPLRHAEIWPKAAAIIVAMGPDDFIVLGTSVIVTCEPCTEDPALGTERAGILFIDECSVENGQLSTRRRLNGDESHQGRHLRIPAPGFGVQRLGLYRYR